MQLFSTVLAQAGGSLFGQVNAPAEVSTRFGAGIDNPLAGIGAILQLVFNILILIGGIYSLLNFILAGYTFLSAGDDPKGVQNAWAKIYQTIIGLVFLAGSFLLAAVISLLIYGNTTSLLSPSLTF